VKELPEKKVFWAQVNRTVTSFAFIYSQAIFVPVKGDEGSGD
jgi:hypothetical protein